MAKKPKKSKKKGKSSGTEKSKGNPFAKAKPTQMPKIAGAQYTASKIRTDGGGGIGVGGADAGLGAIAAALKRDLDNLMGKTTKENEQYQNRYQKLADGTLKEFANRADKFDKMYSERMSRDNRILEDRTTALTTITTNYMKSINDAKERNLKRIEAAGVKYAEGLDKQRDAISSGINKQNEKNKADFVKMRENFERTVTEADMSISGAHDLLRDSKLKYEGYMESLTEKTDNRLDGLVGETAEMQDQLQKETVELFMKMANTAGMEFKTATGDTPMADASGFVSGLFDIVKKNQEAREAQTVDAEMADASVGTEQLTSKERKILGFDAYKGRRMGKEPIDGDEGVLSLESATAAGTRTDVPKLKSPQKDKASGSGSREDRSRSPLYKKGAGEGGPSMQIDPPVQSYANLAEENGKAKMEFDAEMANARRAAREQKEARGKFRGDWMHAKNDPELAERLVRTPEVQKDLNRLRKFEQTQTAKYVETQTRLANPPRPPAPSVPFAPQPPVPGLEQTSANQPVIMTDDPTDDEIGILKAQKDAEIAALFQMPP